MYQLFIMGAIMGYFLPFITFGLCIILLWLKYQNYNDTLIDASARVWTYVTPYTLSLRRFFSAVYPKLAPDSDGFATASDFYDQVEIPTHSTFAQSEPFAQMTTHRAYRSTTNGDGSP